MKIVRRSVFLTEGQWNQTWSQTYSTWYVIKKRDGKLWIQVNWKVTWYVPETENAISPRTQVIGRSVKCRECFQEILKIGITLSIVILRYDDSSSGELLSIWMQTNITCKNSVATYNEPNPYTKQMSLLTSTT